MSEAMNAQASDLENLNNLYVMQSLLNNMLTNIYLIEEGGAGQNITVSNASLFQLASQYYNDATRWTAIAQSNGLNDPYIEPTILLNLNPANIQQLNIFGSISSSNQIVISLNTAESGIQTYVYDVLLSDQIFPVALNTQIMPIPTISQKIASMIPGASYANNAVILPTYISVSFQVNRFVNLIIPQVAVDQGGVLQA